MDQPTTCPTCRQKVIITEMVRPAHICGQPDPRGAIVKYSCGHGYHGAAAIRLIDSGDARQEPVSYRFVRPDGKVIFSWHVSSQLDSPFNVYAPQGRLWLGEESVEPPWRLERRTPDADWQTIDDSDQAAARSATITQPQQV